MIKKSNLKRFIIRKYVVADSAKSAIRKEKQTPVDDVWVDTDWQKAQLANSIGFAHNEEDEE